ncbi:MAG: HlyD family efflux transporter periplasmic adaptor subunit [Planctomycetaceae bacterium]
MNTAPVRSRFPKAWRGVGAVALLLALTALVLLWRKPAHDTGIAADTSLVAPRPQARVHALGRLEPRGEVVNLAPPTGNEGARVEELLVAEGDDVEPRTLIARMDSYARLKAECLEAEARLQAAQARLDQTRAGAKPGDVEAQRAAVALLDEQLRVAVRDLDRADRLRDQKAISIEDYERYQWVRDKTSLELRRAARLLDALAEVRETDVRVQQAEVVVAEQALAAARARLETAEVRNFTAGRILKIHTRAGEKVSDRGLLDLGDVTRMQAVAEVFEGDLALLQPGQPATVRIDGTGEILTGWVSDLGHLVARKSILTNDPVSDTDARVVEVRVSLVPESAARVVRLANARVEVTIDTSPSPGDPSTAGVAEISADPPTPQAVPLPVPRP